ncbi:hypothetical protein PLICRDRAFT_548759 [Plicaturopsis crispa FD-325 SS-3]|nr:hypothetical protein PLICRDRAFT_548759 [Plicaturopsis crispa FD-325 SS-3]
MAQPSLPPPGTDQAYCTLSVLEGGHISCPLAFFVAGTAPDVTISVPSLAFLLKHSRTGKTLLFDLGMRKDLDSYPPAVVQLISMAMKSRVPQDVPESLRKGGLEPSDIDTVALSHLHWDHVGDSAQYTNANFVVGAESAALLSPGYPADPASFFASDLLPPSRTQFVSDWAPLGPFPRAYDLYGDGSVYIVDAPGHLPGHINLLARTTADGGWVYLAGDAAHHWCILEGHGHIAELPDGRSVHQDKAKAEETIGRIKALREIERVRVLLAHDEAWYEANKGSDSFFPASLPSK